jgi:hypothetical protein
MRPADIIPTPVNVLIDLLLSGEIKVEELTDEQIKQIPKSVLDKF